MTTQYIEDVVRQFILNLSAPATYAGTRVYVDEADAPNPTFPYYVVELQSAEGVDDHTFEARMDLQAATIYVAAFSRTRREGREMLEAVRTNLATPGVGLDGFEGQVLNDAMAVIGTIAGAWQVGIDLETIEGQKGETSSGYIATAEYVVQFHQTGHGY